ncbi:MAG TPA: LuxR C-terminal-related transcriptional regulator [Pseudolabrys sp.]|nr:LuxR C-terminal-related transcriptional regulator [Pseudolabrys sp.]
MTESARKIKCPVVVAHPERDVVVPIEEGRALAALIPDCRFVQLDSDNHMPLADEPSWPRLLAELKRFLAEQSAPVRAEAVRAHNRDQLPLDELTPRERLVLEGIAAGQSNSEIAGSLRLSEKTVRNHITRVFDKIGVEHRYEAIVRAREAGLGLKDKATGSP